MFSSRFATNRSLFRPSKRRAAGRAAPPVAKKRTRSNPPTAAAVPVNDDVFLDDEEGQLATAQRLREVGEVPLEAMVQEASEGDVNLGNIDLNELSSPSDSLEETDAESRRWGDSQTGSGMAGPVVARGTLATPSSGGHKLVSSSGLDSWCHILEWLKGIALSQVGHRSFVQDQSPAGVGAGPPRTPSQASVVGSTGTPRLTTDEKPYLNMLYKAGLIYLLGRRNDKGPFAGRDEWESIARKAIRYYHTDAGVKIKASAALRTLVSHYELVDAFDNADDAPDVYYMQLAQAHCNVVAEVKRIAMLVVTAYHNIKHPSGIRQIRGSVSQVIKGKTHSWSDADQAKVKKLMTENKGIGLRVDPTFVSSF